MDEILEIVDSLNDKINKCEERLRELEKKSKVIDQYVYSSIQNNKEEQ